MNFALILIWMKWLKVKFTAKNFNAIKQKYSLNYFHPKGSEDGALTPFLDFFDAFAPRSTFLHVLRCHLVLSVVQCPLDGNIEDVLHIGAQHAWSLQVLLEAVLLCVELGQFVDIVVQVFFVHIHSLGVVGQRPTFFLNLLSIHLFFLFNSRLILVALGKCFRPAEYIHCSLELIKDLRRGPLFFRHLLLWCHRLLLWAFLLGVKDFIAHFRRIETRLELAFIVEVSKVLKDFVTLGTHEQESHSVPITVPVFPHPLLWLLDGWLITNSILLLPLIIFITWQLRSLTIACGCYDLDTVDNCICRAWHDLVDIWSQLLPNVIPAARCTCTTRLV